MDNRSPATRGEGTPPRVRLPPANDNEDQKPAAEEQNANVGRPPKVQQVIVIGAGMAGLAAARELQERGYEVLVVEARGRLGGRLKSVELENATSVDLGGALIHGIDENPLHDVVSQHLGIPTQPVSDCLLLTNSGWPVDPKSDEKTSALFNECLDASFRQISQSPQGNNPFGSLFNHVCREKNVNHGDELFQWHQANLELSCGAGFQELGFLWNEDEPYGFDGEHVAIPTSWTSVCEKLAEPLHIIYEQPVTAIHIIENTTKNEVAGASIPPPPPPSSSLSPRKASARKIPPSTPCRQSRRLKGEEPAQRRGGRNRRQVDLFTVDHSRDQFTKNPKRPRQEKTKVQVKLVSGQSLLADAVVCTVPLGVMKRDLVSFDPPLSKEKRSAIQSLGSGLLNKCAMSFKTRFWPESDFLGLADTENSYLILNAASFTEYPVLIFLFGGTFAKKVESWTDATVVEDCLRVLSRICSRAVPKPLDYQMTRWGHENYSFMSFTYVPPGVDGVKELSALSEPIPSQSNGCPVVMFAGEHTTKFHPSTIHGAFLSGIREAYRLDCFLAPEENDNLEFSIDEIYSPTFTDSSSNLNPSTQAAFVPQGSAPPSDTARGPRRGTRFLLQQKTETARGKISHETTSPVRRSHRSKPPEVQTTAGTLNDRQDENDAEELQRRILERSVLSFGRDYEFIASMVLPIYDHGQLHAPVPCKPEQAKRLCRQAMSPPPKKKTLPAHWVEGKQQLRHGGFRVPSATVSQSPDVKTRSGRISKPVASIGTPAKKRRREPVTKTRSGRRINKPS